jgi:hypothetical protein
MTTYIKPIGQITGKTNINSGLTLTAKQKMIARHINPSKYDFLGFLDRTNEVVLRPRYHNVRNSLGQFAAVAE